MSAIYNLDTGICYSDEGDENEKGYIYIMLFFVGCLSKTRNKE